jgi:diguanylate cyclase (GGDEF)-like protein
LRVPGLFEPALRRHLREGQVVLVIFDVDDMKGINDTYGIPSGDAVLREFGAVIAAERPAGSKAFRTSGDEAAIVFPDGDTKAASRVAEQIRARFEIAQASVRYAAEPLSEFTLSAGISGYPRSDAPEATPTLVADAYRALGEAKAQGRNRVS